MQYHHLQHLAQLGACNALHPESRKHVDAKRAQLILLTGPQQVVQLLVGRAAAVKGASGHSCALPSPFSYSLAVAHPLNWGSIS